MFNLFFRNSMINCILNSQKCMIVLIRKMHIDHAFFRVIIILTKKSNNAILKLFLYFITDEVDFGYIYIRGIHRHGIKIQDHISYPICNWFIFVL